MNIEGAVISTLQGTAAVSAVSTSFFPNAGPEEMPETPFGVYEWSGRERGMTYAGPSSLKNPHLILTLYATSYADVKTLETAVRTLDGFKGVVSDVSIQAIFIDDAPDDYQDPIAAEEFGLHKIALQMNIWYTGGS